MSQTVNTHLLVYTKIYATEQLERFLRHSIERYFKFLEALAIQDANTEPGSGDYKKLVLFQRRVNQIQHYDADRQVDVCDAMVRDKTAPIDSLLKTILLANSMIIGSFGQSGIEKHTIRIPTRKVFIMRVLCIAAKEYFTDPGLLESSRAQRAIVTDAIAAAIQDLFPFEELVGPIVNGQHNFHPSTDDRKFAQNMIDQSQDYSMADVERAATTGGHLAPAPATAPTPVGVSGISHSMSDPMFASMPPDMRPGATVAPRPEPQVRQYYTDVAPAPAVSYDTTGHRNKHHQDMYNEYIVDTEEKSNDDAEGTSDEPEVEEEPRMSRLPETRALVSDGDSDEEDTGIRTRRPRPRRPRRPPHRRRAPRRSDKMGFVDSD